MPIAYLQYLNNPPSDYGIQRTINFVMAFQLSWNLTNKHITMDY